MLLPAKNLSTISCVLHETPLYLPSSDTIIKLAKNHNYLYSDVSYCAKIEWETTELPTKLQLFINGESIEYIQDEITDSHVSLSFKSDMYPFGNIFRDCYGFVQIEIYCEWQPGISGRSYWTDFYCVMLKKTKVNESLQKIAEYVYQNHSNFLWKRNTLPNGAVEFDKSDEKNLDAQIELIKDVINIYDQNSLILKTRPYTLAEHNYIVDDFEKLHRITPNTINYIVQHPDELISTSHETGIKVKNNSFIPRKTLILKTEQSRNSYENGVIIGFLKSVILSVNDLVEKMKGFLLLNNNPLIKVEGYISSSVFILQTTIHHLETKLKLLLELQSRLNILYWNYKSFLPIDEVTVQHIPKLTAVFRMLAPYRQIYIIIDRWFSFGIYDLSNEEFLLPLLINHQLYEYYVLIKLTKIIESHGFKHLIEKDYAYHYPSKKGYVNTEHFNTFFFSNKDIDENITLYYQPVVWGQQYSDILRNGISIRRSTSLSLNKESETTIVKTRNAYYTPDYILKYQRGNQEIYIIIDAKYQNYASVWNQQVEKLSFKYQFSLHSVEKNSHILGVLILYGKSIEKECILENIHDIFFNPDHPAFWISSLTESDECTDQSQQKTFDALFSKIRSFSA